MEALAAGAFGTLAAPAMSPGGGIYEGAVLVALSAEDGATIRYTTNGGTPAATSPIYAAPLGLVTTTTLKAKAFHPDYTTSAETAATYTIRTQTPDVSVGSGSYAPGTTVTIASPDPAATLRFTLTGADPTTSDPTIASGATLLVGGFTLKVRAFKAGCIDSVVAAATYSLTAPLSTGAVAAGDAHTVLATPDGLLYAWGEGASGRLGDGSSTDRTTPTLISTLTGVTALAAGAFHTLAATWDGRLFACGSNGSGRLGDGTTTSRTRPVHITTLSTVVRVAAGDSHSLALDADGFVYAWGSGSSGRLGLGSTTSYDVPMLVPGLSGVVDIAAGGSHSLAVTSTGQLYAWGLNGSSQLGDGSTTSRLSPTMIATVTDALEVVAGASHSLALMQDGTLYAWGAGTSGQLGLGTTTTRSTPTLIPDLAVTELTAGGDHSAAVRNGVLVSWGANGSGQLGDTTMTMRTSPTVVVGPAAVGALTSGDSHTVAVTPDGHVWTWGAGSSGRLGDGTTVTRPTPQEVFTAGGLWGRTSAPLLSVASGTYHSPQTVVVSNISPDAVMRYATSGATPTESDPFVPPNGEIVVDHTLTLRVRAWTPDRSPSAIVTASYTLRPATPTITPGSSTYTTPQDVTVTVQTTTPSTTLHYTLDGSDPDEASPVYTGPLVVNTSIIVRARAFRDGWSPSDTASATFTFDFGVLDTPSASPGGGLYNIQAVVLTAAPGTSIRYTLNGADPTETSSLYVATLMLGEGTTTLKARAFQTDWTPSATVTETYTVDLTPPAITASEWPSATAAGWHSSDVTITFMCADASGVPDCPAPVVITGEGAGQIVTRTVTDGAGNQASASVTVNVDRVPAEVLTSAPADGTTTTATSIVLTGQVSDALSGIVNATCNGAYATVVDGQVECTVALQLGINSVVLHARDAAGNAASSGVRVTRAAPLSALRIYPSRRTLVVGESQPLTLIDEYGPLVETVTWTSSDPSVVAVSNESASPVSPQGQANQSATGAAASAKGQAIAAAARSRSGGTTTESPDTVGGLVTAVAVGEVTITATSEGITTEAIVTVVAGTSLSAGTSRWAVAPAPGFEMQSPIYTHRVDPSVSDLFTVETNGAGATIVHAMTASGESLRTEAAPGTPVFSDAFGGIVGEVRDAGNNPYALARFAGPATAAPWRYESSGYIGADAQAPDGTIYAVEWLPGTDHSGEFIWDKYAVAIDGQTGRLRARVPLPRDVYDHVDLCGTSRFEEPPDVVSPIVGSDGSGYFQVRHLTRTTRTTTCNSPFLGSKDLHQTLTLLRMGPDGDRSSEVFFEYRFSGADDGCDWFRRPRNLVPDGLGGILATWERYRGVFCGGESEKTVTRFDAEGARTDYPFPSNMDIVLSGDDGTVYLAPPGGAPLTAVDVRTWTTKWATSPSAVSFASPVMALAGGGMATHNQYTSTLTVFGDDGNVTAASPMPVWGDVVTALEYGFWHGISTITGAFEEIVGPRLEEALYWFRAGRGNRERQNTADDLRQGIYAKTHGVTTAWDRHIAILISPTNQDYWRDAEPGIFDKPVPGSSNLFFGTLGAGANPDFPEVINPCYSSVLSAAFNRDRDWQTPPLMRPERLRVSVQNEDMWISSLIERQRNYIQYHNNEVDYACPPILPSEDGWNSNSYARGLLEAAELPLPIFPSLDTQFRPDPIYPGWYKPVPIEKFEPEP